MNYLWMVLLWLAMALNLTSAIASHKAKRKFEAALEELMLASMRRLSKNLGNNPEMVVNNVHSFNKEVKE